MFITKKQLENRIDQLSEDLYRRDYDLQGTGEVFHLPIDLIKRVAPKEDISEIKKELKAIKEYLGIQTQKVEGEIIEPHYKVKKIKKCL